MGVLAALASLAAPPAWADPYPTRTVTIVTPFAAGSQTDAAARLGRDTLRVVIAARELARAMGGDLDVASVPGSGSSFILALPGPTQVDRDILRVALVRAIASEEIRLEERAVLRAIRAAEFPPRSVTTPATRNGCVDPAARGRRRIR